MEIHGERMTIEDVHAPHNLKVGDKVKPKIGPHKGQTHDVMYVHPDGRVLIRPSHPIKRSRVSYRLGAVNAQPHQLDLVDDPKNARDVVHRYAPYLEEHSDPFRMTQQLVRESIGNNPPSHLMAKYGKDGKTYHLWQMGNHRYELTMRDPHRRERQFKSVETFPDDSLEDVKAQLKKDGYKELELEEHSDLFRMTQQLVREANEKEEKKDSEKKDTEDKDSEESSKKEKKPEEKKSGKIELSAKKDVFNAEPTTTPNVWQQT